MLLFYSRNKPYIRAVVGIALVAFGIIANAGLVLLGGAALAVFSIWSAVSGRSRRPGGSQPAEKLGGRR